MTKLITQTIKLSQTALKDFEQPNGCLYLWQKIWIDKVTKRSPTLAMLKGSYLEYLCLGSGAGHGGDVTDLPRVQHGKKSVDQIRIEEQAEIFHKNMKAMGFTILKETIQMKLETDDFIGILDFMAMDREGEVSKWDLKGCENIYSEFGFTNWSRPATVDYTQQEAYDRAWYKISGEITPNYLYVADHQPAKNVKVLKLQYDPFKRFKVIENRLNNAYEVIEAYVNAGVDMPHTPSNKNCKDCPFKESCEYRFDYPEPELVVLDF